MKIVTMVTIVAVLLNAMMPTLAHAVIYLQGTEVNTNTLIRDAYVQVTYRDLNGEEKTERGWIDAVGETTFVIREGGFRSKKIIAYNKVVSVVMSDESTVPAKQMNEVNRFIRTMKNIQQAIQWQEVVTVMSRVQIDLSKIAKRWYAYVVYTSNGMKETAIGKITDKDADHIVIQNRDRFTKNWKIAYSDIDILAVAKYPRDIEGWKNARSAIQLFSNDDPKSESQIEGWKNARQTEQQFNILKAKVRVLTSAISKERIIGKVEKINQDTLVIQGGHISYQVSVSSISSLEVSIGQYRNTGKGMLIGFVLGLTSLGAVIRSSGVSNSPGYNEGEGLAALGALYTGLCVSIPIFILSTVIGYRTKSDKWFEVPPQRLNLSLAPTSSKGLRAALTFNF